MRAAPRLLSGGMARHQTPDIAGNLAAKLTSELQARCQLAGAIIAPGPATIAFVVATFQIAGKGEDHGSDLTIICRGTSIIGSTSR